ncbi:flagellar basal body P-ring formation chaperone FlgA [Mariniblastus fucicola]|uniref:Flagellar basal body P-ring biosynthesis protein FlgA n=1 Tax=Mariniblastus fucicola TaxID=980251 RepID=A0A5B9PDV7_9BACT|nr:flagellar basal body P-ring formation chaperone FlgA [Mariniblastus fucicola]QEG23385.1 flagellar basal body P-ring biosynthesis protein FlgA [Mariniblastus fucicola]
MIRKAKTGILAAIIGLIALSTSLHASEVVQVIVRSNQLTVADGELSIGDVCDVRGGSPLLRNRIKTLDLDLVVAGKSTVVSRQQVAIRIALDGVARTSISLSGPEKTTVNLIPNEKLQERLEAKLGHDLSFQFGIGVDDVRVRLLNLDVIAKLRDSINTGDFEILAFFPAQLPLGDKYIQVEYSDSSGNRVTHRTHVQIVVMQNVFVTSGLISKGTVITAGHVQNIKRPLMDGKIELAGAECVGCVASRDIAPHQIVTSRHLSRRPVRKQVLVKRNDLVDIVLMQGRLRVRVKNAKVMTSGARGEMVRVLNTNSNKEINAVVYDRTTVVVTQ